MLTRLHLGLGATLLVGVLVACTGPSTTPTAPGTTPGTAPGTPAITTNTSGLDMTLSNSSTLYTQGLFNAQAAPAPSGATPTHIFLTFTQAQIHYDGPASASAPATESADADTSWITIPGASTSSTVDLLNLANDSAFGSLASLNNGTYTQIRVAVSSASIVTTDNSGNPTTSVLTIPSNELKIIKPFEVKAGYHTTLHFNFDTNHSVVYANGGYMMRPTAVHSVATYTANASMSPSASPSTTF